MTTDLGFRYEMQQREQLDFVCIATSYRVRMPLLLCTIR